MSEPEGPWSRGGKETGVEAGVELEDSLPFPPPKEQSGSPNSYKTQQVPEEEKGVGKSCLSVQQEALGLLYPGNAGTGIEPAGGHLAPFTAWSEELGWDVLARTAATHYRPVQGPRPYSSNQCSLLLLPKVTGEPCCCSWWPLQCLPLLR